MQLSRSARGGGRQCVAACLAVRASSRGSSPCLALRPRGLSSAAAGRSGRFALHRWGGGPARAVSGPSRPVQGAGALGRAAACVRSWQPGGGGPRTVGRSGLFWQAVGRVSEGTCSRRGGHARRSAQHPQRQQLRAGSSGLPKTPGSRRRCQPPVYCALSVFFVAFILAALSFSFCLRASLLRGGGQASRARGAAGTGLPGWGGEQRDHNMRRGRRSGGRRRAQTLAKGSSWPAAQHKSPPRAHGQEAVGTAARREPPDMKLPCSLFFPTHSFIAWRTSLPKANAGAAAASAGSATRAESAALQGQRRRGLPPTLAEPAVCPRRRCP